MNIGSAFAHVFGKDYQTLINSMKNIRTILENKQSKSIIDMKIVISELPQKEVFKGFLAQMTHTANTTLSFWEIQEGAVLPMHSHVHEQITQVVEGKLQLTIGGETTIYENGSLAIIPSNVVHGGIALTPCKVFDIFTPVREDYKNLSF